MSAGICLCPVTLRNCFCATNSPAAIMARDQGASVIVIDANHDIGGHAMISGGRVPLGGGTSWQKKYGITDSADQVYFDHTSVKNPEFLFGDRDLIRVWADENAPTFEFLLENGVIFNDRPPTIVNGGSVPRLFIAISYSDNLNETINGSLCKYSLSWTAAAQPAGTKQCRNHGQGKDQLSDILVTGTTCAVVNKAADKGKFVQTGGPTSVPQFTTPGWTCRVLRSGVNNHQCNRAHPKASFSFTSLP